MHNATFNMMRFLRGGTLAYPASLLDLDKAQEEMSGENSFELVWDCGASLTIANDLRLFDGEIKPPSLWRKLTGLA